MRWGVFVALLLVLNAVFYGLGAHQHISVVGSIMLSLVVTAVMYGFRAMKQKP
jgi:inner membrane protein involved in colicin E2 resistance